MSKNNETDELEIEKVTQDSTDGGTSGVPVVQQLTLLSVVLLLIFGTSVTTYFLGFFEREVPESDIAANAQVPVATEVHTLVSKDVFEDLAIIARAAYVWDVANQRPLYTKNETDILPLASITKLMTALLAQEILDENREVEITGHAIGQDGDSGFVEGESFNRLSLSDLTLLSSSNDGAFALAREAGSLLDEEDPASSFVAAMNIRADELGLSNMSFKNPTGLDISLTESGSHGSARDVTFLMEYILLNQPDILALTKQDNVLVESEAGYSHEADNTNYYIDEIPNLIGSKTGFTDLAGGNLVIAFDAGLNRPIIVTVLGSTLQGRFTDTVKLVRAAQEYVTTE